MKKYRITNLDCPNCAQSLQNTLQKQPFVKKALINFSSETILLDTSDLNRVKQLVFELESGVQIKEWEETIQEAPIKNEIIFLMILLSGFGISFLIPLSFSSISQILLYCLYLIAGIPVFKRAYKSFKKREFFDENSLMLFATISAFCIQAESEAVAVMLFFRIGEFFENLAVRKSRKNIQSLIDLSPSYAWKKQNNGSLIKVQPNELQSEDVVVIKAGEKIPSDGIILKGESELEEKMLNGESMPRFCKSGDEVYGGSINLLGTLEVKITKPYAQSGISQIISLVEQASSQKSQSEKRITAFAKIYTPCVFVLSLLIALLPPLLGYGTFEEWIYRALVVLMVSCPCALVLSVPLGYFGGIGGASKHGILIKGANFLESLAQLKLIAFDKTGTLTKGEFEVEQIISFGDHSQEEILQIAMCAEHLSNHPIARSLQKKTQHLNLSHAPTSHNQIAGRGMDAHCCGRKVLVGNKALLDFYNIECQTYNTQSALIYVALEDKCIGCITLRDSLKENAKKCLQELQKMGIETMILSGDREKNVQEIAQELGVKQAYGDLLPRDKLNLFQIHKKKKSAFVGDGINDAPVLSSADVGISMGLNGSDLSKESSDVVLANDDLDKLIKAIKIAYKTRIITSQNIILALGIKGTFIFLGIFGVAGMWEAVFGDVGVALLALANASRILR